MGMWNGARACRCGGRCHQTVHGEANMPPSHSRSSNRQAFPLGRLRRSAIQPRLPGSFFSTFGGPDLPSLSFRFSRWKRVFDWKTLIGTPSGLIGRSLPFRTRVGVPIVFLSTRMDGRASARRYWPGRAPAWLQDEKGEAEDGRDEARPVERAAAAPAVVLRRNQGQGQDVSATYVLGSWCSTRTNERRVSRHGRRSS